MPLQQGKKITRLLEPRKRVQNNNDKFIFFHMTFPASLNRVKGKFKVAKLYHQKSISSRILPMSWLDHSDGELIKNNTLSLYCALTDYISAA